ncbi:DUF983 domain-containing protein [Flagellimonas halotolerans]|uniref:DUF983 domain-containing protein n=1 Tax=Flagellimonas halotolerans TaxID=3112164 RepID=A0ABU6ING1_9FLAO|nr:MULTISPECIES: DUF983 domain-containing protein [unclassified Allomuricauda]MEC3964994.1 DUF983 domain-containing protein [Muricauda sp. SYSU M86414]MEC4264644.1 DUF983 domain-containing protein [Muricauda sp. SYSU M84420]
MLKKGTKMYSILTGNCPRCHEESMYEKSNPYTLSKIFSMNERCSHCGLKYKIEPSFFYGAMYVSYGVGIAFAVAAFVISFLFIGTSLLTTFIAIVGTLIVFMPVIIRLSRNIWINFFVKYDPTSVKKHEAVKT